MKKLISTRQLIFMLIISLVTLKVLFLPSLLVKDIGRDSYIFFFLMLLLDFLVLCIFLYLYNKFPELSFYQIIQKFFGTVIAKIIMFLFCLFFLAKCWAVFQSNFVYLNENLHSTIKWYTFSIPILVVVFYMSTFGFNAFGRLVEIMFPIIVVGFLLGFFTGLFRADFSNLLPICENGFFSYIPKISQYAFWFGDYLVFVVFFGNVKRDEKFNLKVLVSVGVSVILLTIFLAIVYSVFSYATVCHTNSISDIMQVLPSSSDIGGFDWVIILIWDISLFLYLTLNVLSSYYCIKQIMPKINKTVLVCLLLIIILGSNLLTHFDIIHNVEIGKKYIVYFSSFMQYGLPVLFLVSAFIYSLKNGRKAKNNSEGETNKLNTIKLRNFEKKENPSRFKKLYFQKNNMGKKFTVRKKEQKC